MQSPPGKDAAADQAQDSTRVFVPVQPQIERVRRLMRRQLGFGGASAEVTELVNSFDCTGGKMLRAALLLLVGRACGRITTSHIRAAAAIELIHGATLLHDDVIDGGQKRRGKPTINALWGNESAVLLGDLLLSAAFGLCAGLGSGPLAVISSAATRMCRGEIRQLLHRKDHHLTERQYIEIIADKSASLFECCCRLAAELSHARQSSIDKFGRFGHNLGIAFQITDDLLDIVGNESRTGKTLGTDVHGNKPTLAVIHLLDKSPPAERAVVDAAISSAGANRSVLTGLLQRYGSLEYARLRAQNYAAQAAATISDLSEGAVKEALLEAAHFAANRVQ